MNRIMRGYRSIVRLSAVISSILIWGGILACHSKAGSVPKSKEKIADNKGGIEYKAEKWADSVISTLSPRERIAQLFVPRLDITDNAAGYRAVERVAGTDRMGGFLLGKGTPESYSNLINYGQSLASIPLMITLDGEWGLSMRVSGTPRFPYNIALGAADDDQLMYEYGREMARECRLMGIQVNFAPDLDVNSNPDNPVIGYRSFGEDPEIVGRLGAAYSRGMWQEGVMPVGKHFPGHGDTSTDSHKTLPIVDHDRRHLDSVDVRPFVKAFGDGMPAIMVGHLKVPALDSSGTPASLSKKITTDFLQNDLGFSGLVFTDALAMKGASMSGENNCVSALLAGADILLGSGNPAKDLDAVAEAVSSGRISQNEIDKHCRKVLTYKYMLGLDKKPHVDLKNVTEKLNTPYVDSLIMAISRKAVTVARDRSSLLPVDSKEKSIVLISIGAPSSNPFSNECRLSGNVSCYSVDGSSVITSSVLDAAKKADIVLIGVFKHNQSAVNAFKSLSGIDNAIGVFFMNPFKVVKFPGLSELGTIVLGYDDIPAIRKAAAEAIFGKIKVTGKMPVNLPGLGTVEQGIMF